MIPQVLTKMLLGFHVFRDVMLCSSAESFHVQGLRDPRISWKAYPLNLKVQRFSATFGNCSEGVTFLQNIRNYPTGDAVSLPGRIEVSAVRSYDLEILKSVMYKNTSCKHKLLCPVWSGSLSKPGVKGGKSLSPLFVLLVSHQFLSI